MDSGCLHVDGTMKYFQLHVYCGGIPVSLIAVKHDKLFNQTISRVLYTHLQNVRYSVHIAEDGIVVQSLSLPDGFLGATLPFFLQNRQLELRVMDTYWEK